MRHQKLLDANILIGVFYQQVAESGGAVTLAVEQFQGLYPANGFQQIGLLTGGRENPALRRGPQGIEHQPAQEEIEHEHAEHDGREPQAVNGNDHQNRHTENAVQTGRDQAGCGGVADFLNRPVTGDYITDMPFFEKTLRR